MTDPTVGIRIDDLRGLEVAAGDLIAGRSLYVTYGLKYCPSSRTISKVPSARI